MLQALATAPTQGTPTLVVAEVGLQEQCVLAVHVLASRISTLALAVMHVRVAVVAYQLLLLRVASGLVRVLAGLAGCTNSFLAPAYARLLLRQALLDLRTLGLRPNLMHVEQKADAARHVLVCLGGVRRRRLQLVEVAAMLHVAQRVRLLQRVLECRGGTRGECRIVADLAEVRQSGE